MRRPIACPSASGLASSVSPEMPFARTKALASLAGRIATKDWSSLSSSANGIAEGLDGGPAGESCLGWLPTRFDPARPVG